MFAKVFTQILDSSVADNHEVRHVFEDLLKLCDINGAVDMPAEAIARRTNAPLEVVKTSLHALEQPDPRSRNPDHEGRRIVRLDENRDWGWSIVNYDLYRRIENEVQRRAKNRDRVQRLREKRRLSIGSSMCNEPVTLSNACNGMEREMEKYKGTDTCDRTAEPLSGFPKTPDAAKGAAGFVGCPEPFAVDVWNKAMSRAGRDAKDVPIRSWQHYLATEWKYERERIERNQSAGQGIGQQRTASLPPKRDFTTGIIDPSEL